MKRKHKQILIIWVGLLAGLLIFRGGWMTYAGLLIFLLDLGLVWWLLRCPTAESPFGSSDRIRPAHTAARKWSERRPGARGFEAIGRTIS